MTLGPRTLLSGSGSGMSLYGIGGRLPFGAGSRVLDWRSGLDVGRSHSEILLTIGAIFFFHKEDGRTNWAIGDR